MFMRETFDSVKYAEQKVPKSVVIFITLTSSQEKFSLLSKKWKALSEQEKKV